MAPSYYVAFLRGINVGGHRAIPMADVRKAFSSAGCLRVRTVLATGNVLFDAGSDDGLAEVLRKALLSELALDIHVTVRSVEALRQLVVADPFATVVVTAETRLYLTLLDEPPPVSPILPYSFSRCAGSIVFCRGADVCSAIQLTAQGGTPEMMTDIEALFGRGMTTRNWNTVARILKSAEA
ncbi:MAG: DUF1697 domain-containing protein [Armatimonadetes bacterium]|nr:DUF1697 domain-containing protein [Armatimonadota bacterium]MDE2205301.1 DUF1697 domain-containing protein [Armatimonadota bacterium]